MTHTSTSFTTAPTGILLQFNKKFADMTAQEKTDVENTALSYEATIPKGDRVWTIDADGIGILPRGQRA